LKGFKLADLIKFETASWKYSPTHAFYVVMNKKKWDSLRRMSRKSLPISLRYMRTNWEIVERIGG